jgi:hypothetical protein
VLPPQSALQILSAEDEVAGYQIANFNGGAQVLWSTRDSDGGTVSALKMEDETDFANDSKYCFG